MENKADQNKNDNSVPPVSSGLPTEQTPLSEPVSINEKPKPKFSLALVIGIIIFLLVAGSAAGFYAYKQHSLKTARPTPTVLPGLIRDPSPTPDPTADWKTFNNRYFSIKYPPTLNNWQEKCKESSPNTFSLFNKGDKDPCVILNPPTVFLVLASDPKDATEYNPIPTAECANTIKETVVIDGTKADKYKNVLKKPLIDGCFWRNSVYIKFTKNTLKYYLSYFPDDIDEKTAQEILSTFKFTDSQTIDASSWKIYTSNEIIFKYPSSWYVKDDTSKLEVLPNGKTLKNIYTNKEFAIFINREPNPQKISAEQFWNKRIKEDATRNPKYENVTINNLKGITTSDNSLDSHDIRYIFANKNNIITISLNYYLEDFKKAKEKYPEAEILFEKILSTFKFTN